MCTLCLNRDIQQYADDTSTENHKKCPACLLPYEIENTSNQIHITEGNFLGMQLEISGSEILSDQENQQSEHKMSSSSNQGLKKLPKKSKPINFLKHKN